MSTERGRGEKVIIIIMNAIFNDRAKADFDEHIAVTDDWDEFCSCLDKKMVSFCS